MKRRQFIKALGGVAALAVPAGLAINRMGMSEKSGLSLLTDAQKRIDEQLYGESQIMVEDMRAAVKSLGNSKIDCDKVYLFGPKNLVDEVGSLPGIDGVRDLPARFVTKTNIMPPRGRWSA